MSIFSTSANGSMKRVSRHCRALKTLENAQHHETVKQMHKKETSQAVKFQWCCFKKKKHSKTMRPQFAVPSTTAAHVSPRVHTGLCSTVGQTKSASFTSPQKKKNICLPQKKKKQGASSCKCEKWALPEIAARAWQSQKILRPKKASER